MDNNTNVSNNTNQILQENIQETITTQQVATQTAEPINQQTIEQTTGAKQQNTINDQTQIQNQLQSIPTVDQNHEQFINNVQTQNQEKKEEKKEGSNLAFVIILFVIILLAIIFLFPLLDKYI